MNYLLNGVARAIIETFDLPEPILEIGSYQVSGQESIGNLRGLFPGKRYEGIDIRPGPGVDRVANVENLPYADGSFGTILALNTFEHVRHFWKGFAEVRRVLRPDGALLLSVPFFFRIHQYPNDYWRFTPEALKVLLEDYPQKVLGWHGPEGRPLNVWCLAGREEFPTITPQHFQHYRQVLAQYARQPSLHWNRKLRYRLGRFFFGPGPFAPFLEREQVRTHLEIKTRQENEIHLQAVSSRG